jgi:hypothetical protein
LQELEHAFFIAGLRMVCTLFAHKSELKQASSVLTPPNTMKLLQATAPPTFPNSSQLDFLVQMMERSCDMTPNSVSALAALVNKTAGSWCRRAFMLLKTSRAAHEAFEAANKTLRAAAASSW